MKALIQKIKRLLRDRRFRRLWSRTISVVAALVVFVTTYALVLPAITMEREAYCGIPAHQHTDACFEQRLICTIPESPGHRHGDSCYTTHQELACQMEEHTHDPTACYDAEGTLVCQLPEHVHDQTACWKDVTELTCTVEESDGHQHSDACYENALVCGMEVHTHSEECYHNPDEDAEANAVAAMQDGGDGTGAETPDEGVVFETYGTFAEDAGYEPADPNGEDGLPADDGTGIPYDEPILNDEALLNEEGLPGGEGLPSDEGMEGMAAGQEIEGVEDGMPADGEGTTNGEDGMPEQGTDGNPDAALDENGNPTESTQTGTDENGNPVAGTQTELDENGNPIVDPNAPQETAETTDTEQAATGGQLDPAANTYVPNLAPIDFAGALNKRTGIYYYAVQEGETVEDSSSISGWKKIEEDTELGPNDLLRVYLAYTIPAGSLNKTNPMAVYRLPVGLHLTDAQVNAINAVENGIAAQYIDYNTLTLTDPDNYHRYLGAEAIEGTRKPDQDLNEYLKEHTADGGEAQEFISATVRVENVYGTESSSGEENGTAILCQNLIFTFSPYTIEKNQHTYDASGQPTRAGEKVRGWFTLDFNLAQVNLGEPRLEETVDAAAANPVIAENEADGAEGAENPAAEMEARLVRVIRTAEIVFVQEDQTRGLETISTRITVVTEEELVNTGENSEVGNDHPEEMGEGDENIENHENDENIEETAEGEEAEKPAAEGTGADEPDPNETDSEAKKEKTDEEKEAELKEALASMMPAMSFEDSIRVRTGKPAGVVEGEAGSVAASAAEALPRKAKVTVRVEADEGTFPVGTTMVLSAVEDLDTVAETVRDAVENTGSSETPENGEATDAGSDHTTGNAEKTNPANAASAANNPKTYGFQAVDISFRDADGNEIEPAKPVRVAMTSEIVEQIKKDKEADETNVIADPVVVHVDDNGNAEKIDLIAPEEIEPARGRTEEEIREEFEQAAVEEEAKQDDQEKDIIETDASEEIPKKPDEGEANPEDQTENEQQNGEPAEKQQQVQDESSSEENSVFFDTDSFSIYAIVFTVDFHYKAHIITADGKDFIITVTYGPEAGIPDGAKLQVEEIPAGTDEYKSYNEQAIERLNTVLTEETVYSKEHVDGGYEASIVSLADETAEVEFARFFDVSIISNGKKIEPEAAVEVKIEYADPLELAPEEDLQIVHFAADGIEVIKPEIIGNEIIFEQESFSVIATVTTNLSNRGGYALLVRYEGKYYEVMYDGSLQEVTASGTNRYTVSMAEQWTYDNYRVYVTTNNGTEYIDPANVRGISVTNRRLSRTANGNGYYIYNGTSYLGITTDSVTGQLRLSGNNSRAGAGTFFFATLTRTTAGRTVDHIDIGVEAKASVTVPLAYGTYYYADGTVAETVALGEFKNVQGVNNTIPISEADLMSATISSYTLNNGARVEDNSFIITEYTSSTQQGEIDQVRIGGTFPVGWVTLNGNGRRGNIERYITSQNQIYYEVGVTKPVELTLQKELNGTMVDLYQKDSSGNLVKLKVTVDVTLNSSFCFWDDDNECPGIQYTTAYSYWGNGPNVTTSLSPAGMDFRLGTTDDTDASVAAIEIIKYTVNTDGQLISVKNGGTFNFDIYQNTDGDVTAPTAWSGETTETIDYSGYTKVSSKSITAGEAGYGVSYDYSVDRGLVYIQETGNLEGTSITDTDDNTWDYVKTYIQTEYVWRDDDGITHSNVNQENTMRAIPDVVGDYHSTTHDGNLHNTFLEFYVYNVYRGGEVEFRKVDQSGYMIEGASFEMYLTDPGEDTSAITAYRATSARNEETGLVEVDFGSVAYGTYYMIETDAPEGYVRDTNVYRVEVYEGESGAESCRIERKTADGWAELSKEHNLYVFPNTPKYVNDFMITKIDENGRQINGAALKFERLVAAEQGHQYVDYDFDTSTPGNQSTITVGAQNITLGTGRYRISEITVPAGYEGTIDFIYLTVNGDNATITLTDSSGNAIGGVVDTDNSNKTTYSITNDENLVIISMEETTTTSEDHDGNAITSHSYGLHVVNKSVSREVRIRKVDISDTPVPLQNAKFSIVLDGVTYVLISNADGYLEFSGKIIDDAEVALTEDDPVGMLTRLKTGRYMLSETAAPEGYIMLEGRANISVGPDVTSDMGTVKAYDADDNEIEEGDTETIAAYYIISIANAPGLPLPNTGGSGTLRIYLTGILLTALSGLCLWIRREYGSIQQE